MANLHSDMLATAVTCIERTEALVATTSDSTNDRINDSTMTMLQALQRSVDLNQNGFQSLKSEANTLLATAQKNRTLDNQWLLEQIDKKLESSKLKNQAMYQRAMSGPGNDVSMTLRPSRRRNTRKHKLPKLHNSRTQSRTSADDLLRSGDLLNGTDETENCVVDGGESSLANLDFLKPILQAVFSYGENTVQTLMRIVLLLLRSLIILGPHFMELLTTFRPVPHSSRIYLLYGAGYENILRMMQALQPGLHSQYTRILYAKNLAYVPRSPRSLGVVNYVMLVENVLRKHMLMTDDLRDDKRLNNAMQRLLERQPVGKRVGLGGYWITLEDPNDRILFDENTSNASFLRYIPNGP
jgi:hypothetical protein